MSEGLDLYDDVLTPSGGVEDEALQTHVRKKYPVNMMCILYTLRRSLLILSLFIEKLFPMLV